MLISFASELPPWQSWAIPMAGMIATGVVWLVGRDWVAKRRAYLESMPVAPGAGRAPSAETAAAEAESTPERDPFLYGSAMEQRTAVRRRGQPVKIFLSPTESEEDACEGWVLDRSVGGLCVALTKPLAVQSIIHVRPINAPLTTPWIPVEVRNCRQIENRYEAGCKFVRTPVWSILLQFG